MQTPGQLLPPTEGGYQRTMSIRKSVANGLNKAAKALEEDRTKEKLGKTITAVRIGLAQAIIPKSVLLANHRAK